MSVQNDAKLEKRRGRPKGNTDKLPEKKHASVETSDITRILDIARIHNPYKDGVRDSSNQALPQSKSRVERYTGAATSDVASVNGQACPIIIDLEEEEEEEDNKDDSNSLLSALLRHAKFVLEMDTNVNDSLHPATGGKKREIALDDSDITWPPERKRRRKKSTSLYNAETIARDILRAAGIHPTLPPLNLHLLQNS